MGKTAALLLCALAVVFIPIRVMAEGRVVDGAGGCYTRASWSPDRSARWRAA